MRMMIDLGRERERERGGRLHISYIMDSTPTSVDCSSRDVRFRRSFRSIVECMVPACCGGFQQHPSVSVSVSDDDTHTPAASKSVQLYSTDSDDIITACASSKRNTNSSNSNTSTTSDHDDHHESSFTTTTRSITGTFFGYRKGRVSFCLQYDTRSSPLLLLEFTVPTAYLAREMQHGLLRIALVSSSSSSSGTSSLFSVPVWSMYCNGRKVGFAIRRHVTQTDASVLNLMHSVSVGAGVLPPPPSKYSQHGHPHNGDLLMYLRASFHRVVGSLHSQSFHMINPVGSSAQELSIFLLRS